MMHLEPNLASLLTFLKLLNMVVVHCPSGNVDCAAMFSLTALLRPLQSTSNYQLVWQLEPSSSDHHQYEEQNTHSRS